MRQLNKAKKKKSSKLKLSLPEPNSTDLPPKPIPAGQVNSSRKDLKIKINTSDLMMNKYKQSIMNKMHGKSQRMPKRPSHSIPIRNQNLRSSNEDLKLPDIKSQINLVTTGEVQPLTPVDPRPIRLPPKIHTTPLKNYKNSLGKSVSFTTTKRVMVW